jgi:lipoprotein-anchoring transpeptidase ErfK/SrfK
MGAAAMTLGGGDQICAIHSANNPGSIGEFTSQGYIRMYNNSILTFTVASVSAQE